MLFHSISFHFQLPTFLSPCRFLGKKTCQQIVKVLLINFNVYYRYRAISKSFDSCSITNKETIVTIIFSTLVALFWTLIVLFLWPIFPIESSVFSCTVDMVNKKTLFSFKVSIIIFVFIIPVSLLIFSNVKILLLVRA